MIYPFKQVQIQAAQVPAGKQQDSAAISSFRRVCPLRYHLKHSNSASRAIFARVFLAHSMELEGQGPCPSPHLTSCSLGWQRSAWFWFICMSPANVLPNPLAAALLEPGQVWEGEACSSFL